ncbi:MAG: hypothetical protein ACXWSD_08390, partial [Bdellovibrionota bacterium]
MSLAEQALFLLDIQPSIRSRTNPENFSNLDQTIVASLPGLVEPAPETKTVAEANPFSVASRMSRSNYEDQAKAEALTRALRQIRASHAAKLIQTRT